MLLYKRGLEMEGEAMVEDCDVLTESHGTFYLRHHLQKN